MADNGKKSIKSGDFISGGFRNNVTILELLIKTTAGTLPTIYSGYRGTRTVDLYAG